MYLHLFICDKLNQPFCLAQHVGSCALPVPIVSLRCMSHLLLKANTNKTGWWFGT